MTWLRQDIIESFYHGEQTLYHNTGRCLFESPTAVLINFSVVLQWTIYCPVSGTVAESVLSVKGWLTMHLDVSDVYLRFDRYFESSTRGSTRMTWALETKVRQLDLKNSTSREGCSPQKFCNQVSIKFTQRRTAIRQKKYFSNMWHVTKKQVVTRVDSTPTQILKGCKMPRLDLQTANEEAGISIAQQAVGLAEQDRDPRVHVVSDDTGVFALLSFLLSSLWASVFTDNWVTYPMASLYWCERNMSNSYLRSWHSMLWLVVTQWLPHMELGRQRVLPLLGKASLWTKWDRWYLV